MLTKFLQKLENANHPLLGPTLTGLETWGMWQPENGIKSKIYNAIHICGTAYVLSQYIELFIIRNDIETALRNLSVTMLSTICIVKAGTFIFWQMHWKAVIEYASALERRQLATKDQMTISMIRKYTIYTRIVTYFYWCLVTATVFTVILAPLVGFASASAEHRQLVRNGSIAYPEVLSAWVPFDKSRGLGYWITVIEDSLICFYGGGIVAMYDSSAVSLMLFFAGQLKLLEANCAKLFGDGSEIINYEVARQRIKDCHYHHLYLIKNMKILNSLLSPVMFVYVIICSLMICASAVQLTTEDTTSMQRIWVAEYLVALIAQLFVYCWHSTEVLYMSEKVDGGVYASAWWTCDLRTRRLVTLLGGQLRRRVVFTAGNFTQLNVATFIAILRGAYSYFTLLSKKEN